MVLTNIELWAADGSTGSSLPLDFASNNPHTRQLNPFDPRVVPQLNSSLSHLSSNGYYGFSYINAAHAMEVNNNNNHISNNNDNNNNSTTCNLMANNVNGMSDTFATTATFEQTHASSVNFGSSAYAAGHAVNVPRCKKRFFVMNDDDDDDVVSGCTAVKHKNSEISAKRCRFDEDFSAQYCNDFFQLPSTQIATQSCLMDTEEGLQQLQQHQQQQVDLAMFENNNNNIEKYEQKLNPQLQNLSANHHHHQQQQHQQHSQQQLQTQQQQEPQQQNLYHQQQHYQDKQFPTIKCHFNHNNNCDTLTLNNQTYKIDLQKNTENVLEIHNPNVNSSIQNEHDKYDNDVANDFKIDDATLFAQLHGGCLHHYDHHFNRTVSLRGDYIVKKDAINYQLKDNNYCEEF